MIIVPDSLKFVAIDLISVVVVVDDVGCIDFAMELVSEIANHLSFLAVIVIVVDQIDFPKMAFAFVVVDCLSHTHCNTEHFASDHKNWSIDLMSVAGIDFVKIHFVVDKVDVDFDLAMNAQQMMFAFGSLVGY